MTDAVAQTGRDNQAAPEASEVEQLRQGHVAGSIPARVHPSLTSYVEALEGIVRAVVGYEGTPGNPRPDLLWWRQCQAAGMLALAKKPISESSTGGEK